MKIGLLLLLCALVAACTPFQPEQSVPVFQVINIAITPALRPLTGSLQICATEQENVILNMIETPTASLMATDAALYIQLGEPETLPVFIAPLAWEEVVTIIHPSNANAEIDVARIRAYYTDLSNPQAQSEVHLLVALDGDETRFLFDRQILQNAIISPFAQLVPDPQVMLEIVSSDPQAIGYVPKAWLDNNTHMIELGLFLPILIMGNNEPSAEEVKLVSCLQTGIGQTLIAEKYIAWNNDPNAD